MRLHVLSTIFCVATMTVAAHADTMFSVTAASFKPPMGTSAVTLSGTLAENGTIFTTSNLTATKGGLSYSFSSGASSQGVDSAGGYSVSYTDVGGDILTLDFAASSLAGFAGGPICVTSSVSPTCGISGVTILGTATAFATGTLAPAAAATPEPSTLALLGTGIVSAVGAIRRRINRAA